MDAEAVQQRLDAQRKNVPSLVDKPGLQIDTALLFQTGNQLSCRQLGGE